MASVHIKTLNAFFSKFTKLTYKKGEIILRGEDEPSGVMYLEKGFVRQYFIAESGSAFTVHIFKPGSFFPMTWVINDMQNVYYFEALTPTALWRAPKEATVEFLSHHPEIVLDFGSRLLTGVSGMLERFQHLAADDAYDKLVHLLVYYADQFGKVTPAGMALGLPLTHKEISSWIGTTRETASVQVELLKKKGLIRYKGRQLVIPNMRALAKERKR